MKVWAQYHDTDGTEDIVAAYVWWQLDGAGSFTTPNRIADPAEGLEPQAESNEFWGIMIRRESGSWQSVYAPYITATDAAWVKIGEVGGTLDAIKDDSGNDIVQVYNISITEDPVASEVEIEFLLDFINGTSTIAEGTYSVMSLANDVDGFLPFEAYPEIEDEIIDYNFWQDDNTDWNIDMTDPTITNPSLTENVDGLRVNVRYTPSDETALSNVRIDACRSGGSNTSYILSNLNSGYHYIMEDCDDFDLTDITNSNYLYYSSSPTSGVEITDVIRPEDNEGGSITFIMTAMDVAGNYVQSSVVHHLGEWVVTRDGFVYGTGGVSSMSRNLDTDAWDSSPLVRLLGYALQLIQQI